MKDMRRYEEEVLFDSDLNFLWRWLDIGSIGVTEQTIYDLYNTQMNETILFSVQELGRTR